MGWMGAIRQRKKTLSDNVSDARRTGQKDHQVCANEWMLPANAIRFNLNRVPNNLWPRAKRLVPPHRNIAPRAADFMSLKTSTSMVALARLLCLGPYKHHQNEDDWKVILRRDEDACIRHHRRFAKRQLCACNRKVRAPAQLPPCNMTASPRSPRTRLTRIKARPEHALHTA